jgi:allantoate deiminase
MARTDPEIDVPKPAGAASLDALAAAVLRRCDQVAQFTEEPGRITRTFLSPPMKPLHQRLEAWMCAAGMRVHCDAIGNLIGRYPGATADAPVFLIGSHLDTVPNGGKYDGVLGVLLGVAAVEALAGRRLPFGIDVVAFSEEEGVRYRTPYLGSLALCGRLDPALMERTDARGISLANALRNFGLDSEQHPQAAYPREKVLGYLEAHIEQGPILESLDRPLGVVEGIAGQSRLALRFQGKAGHAGTLPMELRFDALTAAAQFVLQVEQCARMTAGLRATVGTLTVEPGAVNVVPGIVRLTLDLRHAQDAVREVRLASLVERAKASSAERGVRFHVDRSEHFPSVAANPRLTELLVSAVEETGVAPYRMVSGAGHDAAVMAGLTPMTMLFVRSPGGVSHHPDETVLPQDVRLALEVMVRFLDRLVT